MPLLLDPQPAESGPPASQDAPGSTIALPADSQAVPARGAVQVVLATREDCIASLERLARAVQAGRVGPTMANTLSRIVSVALAEYAGRGKTHMRQSRSETANRPSADPERDPEPVSEPVEPTWEELIGLAAPGGKGRP